MADSTPSAPHLRRGASAEARACAYLSDRGLRLRARNYRARRGEIDLVMDDGEVLVFVEVRYRKPGAPVGPLESVTAAKQRRIAAAAEAFLARHPEMSERRCRFDVVGVDDGLTWVKAAFEA